MTFGRSQWWEQVDHSLEGYRIKNGFGRGPTPPHAPPLFVARFAMWPILPIPEPAPSKGQQRNGLNEGLPVQNPAQSWVWLGKKGKLIKFEPEIIYLTHALLYVQEKQYFSFPGELLMRMLKMLILPLITSSLMSGLATMDSKACGKMGVITITYYLWTTFMAVTVGIILVVSIHPGAAAQKDNYSVGKVVLSSADALLDLIRCVLEPSTAKAAVTNSPQKVLSSQKTLSSQGEQENHWPGAGTSKPSNMGNVLCLLAGLLLGKMGERGAPLVNVCQCLNEAVMKIVSMAVWYFPFGIVFLIAGKILEMEDPSVIGQKLGLYVITVVSGLAVHGIILLPLLFVLITKKNPFAFIQGILQALLIALATSSRAGMWLARETWLCLARGARGHRCNSRENDAPALSEMGMLLLLGGSRCSALITASAASIGAAGIPQSGLVTMVIVLTSVGLPTEDITLIIAVDWAL
uniref:Amino acid transporter n=1 Tax=Junco hyemalis TaxID=40217 RepID=A0A8C5JKG2_JUNHY